MKNILNLKNNDYIEIKMFGKNKEVYVFSTGDNRFDRNGNYKERNFALSLQEIECLDWFIKDIQIDNYIDEIINYCNKMYEAWSDKKISKKDIEKEIDIYAIAINITKKWKSKSGVVYPEISFYGDCLADEENGICIGFRDKKFLGIASQDWTL